ncbi:MAG: vancomycin high temperature exclusion protein, partial [Candidatus Fimenecus sp.]
GDHGKENYDEVNHMKQYCVDKGIDPDIIFLDHAGFSTYESMYRAKEIFGVKKMIVVTQGYHLYRAVYIARALGVEAYGVAADLQDYALVTDIKNNLRESLARVKDFGTCLVKPEPTYLGDTIPIDGSAKLSDDKEYV